MTKPIEPIFVDKDTICRMLNRTYQSLHSIAKTGKYFPISDAGKWDLEKTVRGFVQYLDDKEQRDSNKKKEFDAERVRKIKMANDKEAGELVELKKLTSEAAPTLQKIKDITYQKLTNEMPIAVAGMDVPQSRIYGTRLASDLLAVWGSLFKKWGV